MEDRQSRREFLKSISYIALSLPFLSFMIARGRKTFGKSKVQPHEASYYKRLAG